jgi:hypothetical protein
MPGWAFAEAAKAGIGGKVRVSLRRASMVSLAFESVCMPPLHA